MEQVANIQDVQILDGPGVPVEASTAEAPAERSERNPWRAIASWPARKAWDFWLALLLWLDDTWLDIVHATRSWIQYGTVGFAVLCILIGAVEALFGR